MQLLGASITPNPEFVSLSILLKPQDDNCQWESIVEPTILVSPSSTVSGSCADRALYELHNHLSHVFKASSLSVSNKASKEDSVSIELLRVDEVLLSSMQIYRPSVGHGFGLYYRVVSPSAGGTLFTNLVPLSMPGKNSASSGKVDLSKIQGVIVAVAISGLASAYYSSPLEYALSQRMDDCFRILESIGTEDTHTIKTLLSSFLVWEDEAKKPNSATESRNTIIIPDHDEGVKSLISPLRINRNKPTQKSVVKSSNMQISKIRMAAANTAESARSMVDRMALLSISESQTLLRKYDTPGLQRRANLDFSGVSKSRFRRRKADAKDADFDGFDFKGQARPTAVIDTLTPQSSTIGRTDTILSLGKPPKQFQGPKKDTRTKVTSVPTLSAPRGDASQIRRKGKLQFDDDGSENFKGGASVASVGRIQVNIALNEDLSCSYKESQLATCNVEGIIQVQLKSTSRTPGPFYLLLRDPSQQIASLQENKKFAEDVSTELVKDSERDYADRKFTVKVPKTESYYPILRYKCSSNVRPVPIRVQTRVKVDDNACRVALQISSNPNNSASLTDLTIIMNAPDVVKGETLMTQPAGGVWDEEKRGVVWCVSELGGGEKFQLQARFETVENCVPKDSLQFPVMVRCQCLFAQLSDIEMEVRDMPEVYSAEVAMKVARRFRLSHREK